MIRIISQDTICECDHCGNKASVAIATRRQHSSHMILMCDECKWAFGDELMKDKVSIKYHSLRDTVDNALEIFQHVEIASSVETIKGIMEMLAKERVQ